MFTLKDMIDDSVVTLKDLYNSWQYCVKGNGFCDGDSFLYFLNCLISDMEMGRTDFKLVYGSWNELYKIQSFCDNATRKNHPELY